MTLDVNVDDAILIVFPTHNIESADPDQRGMTCPGSGVRMMRSGRPHADEHARLAELMNAYAAAERIRIAEEREAGTQGDLLDQAFEQRRRRNVRAVPDPPSAEDIAREAREFDEFAERAARLVEERNRRRQWREPDLPVSRDVVADDDDERQTIREILDDDSIRLIEPGDSPDAARSGPPRRAGDPDDNVVPLRREQVPPGVQLSEPTRPVDEYDEPDDPPPHSMRGVLRRLGLDKPVARREQAPEPIDTEPLDPSDLADAERGGVSFGAGPDRPVEEYYPGRPADAPEPGPGEPPAVTLPLDAPITLTPLGRTAMDNAREQLLALISATIEQVGQAQDALAKLTSQLDAADGYTAVIEQEIAAAEALLNMTIGSSGAHDKAEEIRTALHKAKEGTVGQGDGIIAALAIAKLRSETVMLHLSAAVVAANEYSAIP